MSHSKILGLTEAEEWSRLLQELPADQQDIYYTPEYYRLFEDWQGGKALCFVYRQDHHFALYPFLMNSLRSAGYELPEEYFDIQGAYGYNGVITNCNTLDFRGSFHAAFSQWCTEQNVIAEFTRFHPLLQNSNFSSDFLKVDFDRHTVMLSLKAYDTMDTLRNDCYKKEVRKNLRWTGKQGFRLVFDDSRKGWSSFAELYRASMVALNANPFYLFNDNFFRNLYASGSGQFTSLMLVYKDDVLAGGFSFLYYGGYAHNFLSAVSSEGREMHLSEMMQDAAIAWAFTSGFSTMHMGGGNSGNPEDSLLKFKAGFSPSRTTFFTGRKIHNPEIYAYVTDLWRSRFPHLADRLGHRLLAYREQ